MFKGQPPADKIVRDMPFGPGNCSTALLAGADYLFMIAPNDDIYHYVGMPTGSRILHDLKNEAARKIVGRVRDLKDQK